MNLWLLFSACYYLFDFFFPFGSMDKVFVDYTSAGSFYCFFFFLVGCFIPICFHDGKERKGCKYEGYG